MDNPTRHLRAKRPRRPGHQETKCAAGEGWITPPDATGRSHHGNHRKRAFFAVSWRRSDRTSPYSIAMPFCFARPRVRQNVVSFHRDARSAYPPLDHRDFCLLGTVAVDEAWMSHLRWHLPYGTSPHSIAGSCCFVRSGPAADVAPGDRLADRADRFGGGAGVHDKAPTVPGSEVELQVVEQPGVPPAAATRTAPTGVVHAWSTVPVPDEQEARWATVWATPPEATGRSHHGNRRIARAAVKDRARSFPGSGQNTAGVVHASSAVPVPNQTKGAVGDRVGNSPVCSIRRNPEPGPFGTSACTSSVEIQPVDPILGLRMVRFALSPLAEPHHV